MNDFDDAIEDCGLIDAGFEGSNYTWTNHRVWKRLDKVMFSENWLNLFQTTKVSRLPRIWSDHSPLLITLNTNMDTVKTFWQHPTEAQGMQKLQQKLYRLKQCLRWWNRNIFRDTFENVKKAKREVADREKIYDEDPCDSNLMELKRCTVVLTQKLTIKKDYWRQKAACRWIEEGERNTKFFHSLVKKKRSQSRIHTITHEGIQLTEHKEIQKLAAEYFQSFLTNNPIQQDTVIENLCSSPSIEEIRNAIFEMETESVAGPDGFSAFFFHYCWDIIQMHLKDAVEDFFKGNKMLRSYTTASLVLIPKIENPKIWNDFRLISLCNVTNKVIAKILSNRLVNILPKIIAPSQSGFVKGRFISDNILLAQELIHTLNAKRKHDNVALKLDMNKAYDRVQWGFLYKVLSKMGFPEKWIVLVQHCIEHCWFSVLVNGAPSSFFKSSRRLRQGDPLSPSLFIIVADFLYHCNGGLNISHLTYVDDIMIFTNSSKKGLRQIMKLIQHYCKSSVITSNNCSNLITQRLQFIIEFCIKHLPVTYLGATLQSNKKKFSEKSTLSHGGRLALIKSTLSTMPIYLLQVLQPPKMVLHRIDQIMARFFWGTYGENRWMHWVSWDKIYQPINEAGLGVRKLTDMVQTFSLKLWWRFRSLSSFAIWKRMCKARQAAQDNIFWILGDGSMNFFWRNGQWNDSRMRQFLPQHVVEKICRIPILDSPKDEMKWKSSSNGEFTTSSTWNLIRNSRTTRQLLGIFWCSQLTPTMSIFLWRLTNYWIPIDTRLQDKGFSLVSRCHYCSSAVESIPHLFITGEQARAIWEHFSKLFHIHLPQTDNPILLFQYWKLSNQFPQPIHIRSLIPLLIFWFMWTKRNNAKYRNKGFYVHRVFWKIYDHFFCLFKCRKMNRKLWRGDMKIATKLEDHLGNAILAYHEYIGDQNSIYAEIFALTRGLELAKEQGISKLWIEIDAQVVINLITSMKAQGHWKLQEMLAKCKNIMKQMHTRITHIYREGNKVADFLANEACNTQTSRILTSQQLSGPIIGLLRVDQLDIPSFRFR
ncbi:hypothetical protein Pfo_031188 [Paulownia fortunei]|nr:hypothetical protein Pfo_031188 [Paulownia fortunei]